MEKYELIKWARNCADEGFTTERCNECPFRDGGGCADALILNLATELQISISVADFNKALEKLQKDDTADMNYAQYMVYNAVTEAVNIRDNRNKILEGHDEWYMMHNGNLLTAKELIKSYESDTGLAVRSIECVKDYYRKEILVEIPKADITYEMLLKHNKKLAATILYRERNNCSTLSEALEAINHIASNI